MLIIGAGIAGLESARLLRENGIESLVLEGRNRTGGRIWSIRSKSGLMLDFGASFIHGIDGSIPSGLLTNPIWDLAQQGNIPTRQREGVSYLGSYPVDDQKSNARKWYKEFVDFVRNETRISQSNLSIAYYAQLFSIQKNLTEKAQESFFNHLYFMIGDTEGAELDTINAKSYLDLTSSHYGPWHILEQTGFMALTDYLSRDLTNIRLEQIVTKINSTDQFVQVSTKNGGVYRAEYVLITVPLGVLKSRQIEFSPPLPRWKEDVIDRIGFGYYEKVFLIWNQSWWNLPDFYFLRTPSNGTQFRYPILAYKWNNKSILQCTFSGEVALRLISKHNESQVIEDIRNTLQTIFPGVVIPLPDETYFTHWNEDSFCYGSYSYISVKQNPEDPLYLSEPIAGRLLFAGEAKSIDTYGYTHGALLTARREVSRLRFVYNLLPKQEIPTSQSLIITPLKIYIIFSFIALHFRLY